MKTTLISNENNEATFALDFTAEEFEGAVNEVYAKNKKHFEVKGFRKGKAPRSMIEGQYGENIFFEDAVKGYSLYDGKVVRPKEIIDLNVKLGD